MLGRRRTWLWIEAGASAVVGFLLVLRESSAGWLFVLLALVYVALLASPGSGRNVSARLLTRWGWITLAVLVIVLIVVAAWIMLHR
jgi:hypothetical protein